MALLKNIREWLSAILTNVFVNDPTMGYGLYIEWMLAQAET